MREPTGKVQQQVVHLVLDDDGGVHLADFVQAFFFHQAPRQWQFFPEVAIIILNEEEKIPYFSFSHLLKSSLPVRKASYILLMLRPTHAVPVRGQGQGIPGQVASIVKQLQL